MKKLNIYFITGLMALTVVTACKKISKITPKHSIVVGTAFESVKDAVSWDVGIYGTLRGNVNGAYTYTTDIQADQLNATLDYGNNYGFFQQWGSFLLASDQDIFPIWQNYYAAIANINAAITGFKNIKPASAAETSTLNQCTGDMYLARAYYYHRLILRWAKPYEPASAASDPGVPLVLVYDISALPARASVKAVYDQIISDINTAEGLLANVAGKQGSQTFTIDAATALEARVRLHMQDWAGAYAAANKLITANKYPLITNAADFQNYWALDGTQESIMQLYVSPTQLPASYSLYINYVSALEADDPYYLPSQWVVDTYDNADIRKGVYFDKQPVNIHLIKDSVYVVNKYPGNPALYTGATSNYENAPKVFRMAEMYLIAAEAADNNSAPDDAIHALNLLRVSRGLGEVNGLSGDALTQAIRDERFRELAFEGFRLDDLKRWHLGFTRHDPQNTHLLVNSANSFDNLSIPADNNKFVWGLPSNDLTTNPNLKPQNPGW